jgi:hypothetical protein
VLVLRDPLRAEDWRQFRGANRDGVWAETDILESFRAEGSPVRWRAPAGPGFSSPVVAQERVYLVDAELAAPEARFRARLQALLRPVAK